MAPHRRHADEEEGRDRLLDRRDDRDLRLHRLRHRRGPVLQPRLLPGRPTRSRARCCRSRRWASASPCARSAASSAATSATGSAASPSSSAPCCSWASRPCSSACLPTYQQVGVWAGILLVAVRVVQGLAFGAEWGGAILMCFEHAPWRKKGLYTGITQAGFPVGLLLANLAFLVSVPLGDQWAWRVPFLLSAVLIVVGILIRLKIEESPGVRGAQGRGRDLQEPAARGAARRLAQRAAGVLPAHRRDRGLRGVGHLHAVLPRRARSSPTARSP